MLETFAAAAGARVIAAHRCVEQEVRRDGKQGLRLAKMEELVGARRFELPTPCTPCRCATRLRYAPTEPRLYRPAHSAGPSNCRISSSSWRKAAASSVCSATG